MPIKKETNSFWFSNTFLQNVGSFAFLIPVLREKMDSENGFERKVNLKSQNEIN